MKLTLLLTFVITFQVSASVFSQQIKLTQNTKGETVRNVLKIIEKETDIRFFYNDDFKQMDKVVTQKLNSGSLDEMLGKICQTADLSYKIIDNNFVVIYPDVMKQGIKIAGKITDASTGEPLPGVNIRIDGTTQGAVTDPNGNYTITVPSADVVLVFSYVGYNEKRITVGQQTTINVEMNPEIKSLEQVVVVGYGVQQKSNITGAIASANSDDMQNRSVENVGKALQGKLSGVQVVTLSGAPGSSPQFRVRGYSNNETSNPLYIVDGLQVDDIGYLDPSSIASVEVLKDAASAAIYGAQAGNGVVLITTKSGSAGNNRFFYNGSYSNQSQTRKLDMMNADQFKTFWMEEGQPASAFQNANTDWNSVMFENGFKLNQTIGVEGGNDRASYYSALTFNKNDGMVVGPHDTYERVAVQVNASYKANSWLKMGTTNSMDRSKIVSVSSNNFTTTGSAVGGAYFYDPTVPVYYETDADAPPALGLLDAPANGYHVDRNSQGQLYGGSLLLQSNLWNPLLMIYDYTNNEWMSNINGTVYADVTPIKGLVYTSRLGYRFITDQRSNYTSPYYHNHNQSLLHGRLDDRMSHNFYYQWENFVNYAFSLGNNDITALAGMEYTNNNNSNIRGRTAQLNSDAQNYRYLDYSSADANDNVYGNNITQRSISYFGKLGWNYESKYMLQGTFRADAFDASKLSENNRWGYFPAVSGGWTISNENFMKNLGFKALTGLKLRGSWGINGNVSVLSGYPYAPSLSLGGNSGLASGAWYYNFANQLITAAQPSTQLANPDLVWEKSKQTDIGIDARFFENALTFTVDYFYKTTVGLLASGPAPVVSGTSTIMRNNGKIENKGLEFDLGWKDGIGDFKYSITANLSKLHNEVLESPYGEGRQSGGGGFFFNGTYFEKGFPIWYIRGNIVDHIDQTTGQPVYKTAQELGTDDGMAPLGSAIPDYTFGITLSGEYKGFDLVIFGQGQQGSKLLWALNRPDLPLENYPTFIYDERWTSTNTNAKRPSPSLYATGNSAIARYAQSNLWVFDNSYFKIKEIQIGYNFPSRLIDPLKISALRVYVSLEDFFTFTSYPGIDPETMASTQGGSAFAGGMGVDRVQYPAMKQTTFGLNVSF